MLRPYTLTTEDRELLVRRRQRFCLFQLHVFVTAIELTTAGLIAQHFCAAGFTKITFTKLSHNSLLNEPRNHRENGSVVTSAIMGVPWLSIRS